jgi:beta-lactamase regulating signal transducer with metallopeptidase domain/ankyrin repeat protein
MIAGFLGGLEQFFGWLLTASWQASVLALLVLLLQTILRGWLNPRWRYALWLLVIVRLLLPVLPESAFSLFQVAPQPSPALVPPVMEPLFASAIAQPATKIVSSPRSISGYPLTAFSSLSVIWFAGAVSLLFLTWEVNRRFARQVANSPVVTDPDVLALFAATKSELSVSRSIQLIESGQVQSPAIMGLFHPTLLLPANVGKKFDARELRFIFLHELAHLKRGDVIVQALIALLQIFHWFNPVLWFAFRRMRIDREPATDAMVLCRTGEEEKERYGLMLIKLLEHFNQRHSLPTLVGILEDKDQFKRRFSLIARFTRGAYGWSVLGILLIAVLAMTLLTKSKSEVSPSDARVEFSVDGQAISLSGGAQKNILELLYEMMVMRYVNGSPDDVFHWQKLSDSSVDQIKASGSFIHVIYPKKLSLPFGPRDPINEIWIGLKADPTFESYPGYPAGVLVVTSGKAVATNLMFGSKSLLTGLGLLPDVFPHLSSSMQKSLEVNRGAYDDYAAWSAAKDASGQPLNQQLVVATQGGDAGLLKRLLAQGADVTKMKKDGSTLLFSATTPEVAKILIAHGVDPKVRNSSGITALSSLCLNGGKNTAAIARVLLEHGADPNSHDGELKTTPIMGAHDGATIDVLVQFGADVNAVDSEGDNALFWSTWADASTFQALLKHGISYDAKKDGPSVLLHAAWNGNLPLMTWLLDHGVDPNVPGVWVHQKNGKDDMMLPMEAVAISGQPKAGELLLAHGAKGEPATALALQNHYSDIVKLLRDHKVRNISELCYQISQHAPLGDLEKLLQSGSPADPPEDTVITPLGEAAETDNLPAVRLLVQHGANVNTGGNPVADHPEYHDTPLELAAERGQGEIVAFLLQHGARPDGNSLFGAANAGIPNSFYVEHDRLPSKEYYERVIQMLLDAGAAKNITAEWSGIVLAKAISPCWGEPNPEVLQKLLAAGLSPEAPMPDLEERGEKPNSIIGYYRDYYQKNLQNPARSQSATRLKPLLDLLEAADKDAGTKTTSADAPQPNAKPPIVSAPTEAIVNSGPTGGAGKPVLNLKITLVEVNEKAYEQNARAMDGAVIRGDAHFFDGKKDVLVAPAASLALMSNKDWYSVGTVRAYLASAKYEKVKGVPHSTLQAAAIFCGVNADFALSSSPGDGISIDSKWSDTELVSMPDEKFAPTVFPADLPKTINLTPQTHIAQHNDLAWKAKPGETHSFWIGKTIGQFTQFTNRYDHLTNVTGDQVIKTDTPSRLAVFMTALPVAPQGDAGANTTSTALPESLQKFLKPLESAAAESLTVRTFLAPADFFSASGAPANADSNISLTATQDVQPELERRGIQFPTGATATFFGSSNKLVVRDTPEQLDLINRLIEKTTVNGSPVQAVAGSAKSINAATLKADMNAPMTFGPVSNPIAIEYMDKVAYVVPSASWSSAPTGVVSSPTSFMSPPSFYADALAHVEPGEREALSQAFKAADGLLTAMDGRDYSSAPVPYDFGFRDSEPQTWPSYVDEVHSRYGELVTRTIKSCGDIHPLGPWGLYTLQINYYVTFRKGTETNTVIEHVRVDRDPPYGPNGQWKVHSFEIYEKRPEAPYQGRYGPT